MELYQEPEWGLLHSDSEEEDDGVPNTRKNVRVEGWKWSKEPTVMRINSVSDYINQKANDDIATICKRVEQQALINNIDIGGDDELVKLLVDRTIPRDAMSVLAADVNETFTRATTPPDFVDGVSLQKFLLEYFTLCSYRMGHGKLWGGVARVKPYRTLGEKRFPEIYRAIETPNCVHIDVEEGFQPFAAHDPTLELFEIHFSRS